ncbi:HEPN domain-containing protein [Candidatus Bathyarchaeota archaeon]|nr:HEPN domain-containing protein [Candidatus Bathyarchaeota archaeon]
MEEELIKRSLGLFHDMKNGIEQEKLVKQARDIFKVIEDSPLEKSISFDDVEDVFRMTSVSLDKALQSISDEEFVIYFKSEVLTTKTYDFFFPVYCFYGFPNGFKLGYSTAIDFDRMPPEIREYFGFLWEHRFTIDTEYHRTKDEYITLKKRTAFVHLIVKANGHFKAIENARSLAEDALHIIRFLYQINLNIIDIRYKIRENKNEGGIEGIAVLPFVGGANFSKFLEEHIPILTDIFTKSNPNEIEKKIRNALRIFGIQKSMSNDQVRFVLLITCLESLLMTASDRDYILWKLAEQAAFFLGGDRRETNEYVRSAYGKRSAFVHGSTSKDGLVTRSDIDSAEELAVGLVWKLIDFMKKGYTSIQKHNNAKSIDEYIEEAKFGKHQEPKEIHKNHTSN